LVAALERIPTPEDYSGGVPEDMTAEDYSILLRNLTAYRFSFPDDEYKTRRAAECALYLDQMIAALGGGTTQLQ
jgi:hypothetical protein